MQSGTGSHVCVGGTRSEGNSFDRAIQPVWWREHVRSCCEAEGDAEEVSREDSMLGFRESASFYCGFLVLRFRLNKASVRPGEQTI